MVVAPDVYNSELDDELLLQVYEIKSSGSSLGTLSDHGQCRMYSSAEMASKAFDITTSYHRMATGLTFDCFSQLEHYSTTASLIPSSVSSVENLKEFVVSIIAHTCRISKSRRWQRHSWTRGLMHWKYRP